MRMTLNIDEDLLKTAREMAKTEQRSVDAVISDLMRQGLAHLAAAPPADVHVATPEHVKAIWEDIEMEDMRKAIGQ